MINDQVDTTGEVLLSSHTEEYWRRRKRELKEWDRAPKIRKHPKRTTMFNGVEVDVEIYSALYKLNQIGVQTEFSCAGVSPLDEPIEHSLYAYVTFLDGEAAERFTWIIRDVMKHRALLTYESDRNRYDVSSFFIGHNRTFCYLLDHCAEIMKSRTL
ncbi:hypothetical protein ACK8P5_14375 [Paenibacillus sp. EC2-1]|uniref:hypothetical protein n=1 Tax=Paenibacillus sp. EC2-1 TaxID=3388665 RepID=UPI003BEEEBD8